MRDLCGYWADGYEWRATERRLNALPQFARRSTGVGIWLLHLRSPHVDALPLVMTYRWPGSIVEFLKVIGPLTDPSAHGGDAADGSRVGSRGNCDSSSPCELLVSHFAPEPARRRARTSNHGNVG